MAVTIETIHVPKDYAKRERQQAKNNYLGLIVVLSVLLAVSFTSACYLAYLRIADNKAQSQPVLVKSELSKAELRVLKVKGERHEKAY